MSPLRRGCNRVLAVIGKEQDDVIFMSDSVKMAVQTSHDDNVMSRVINRGRKKDKHDNTWRVFELNFMDLFYNVTQCPRPNE